MKVNSLEEAINLLKNNELVAIPTDTVYGLFATVSKENIKKINSIKNSNMDKKISIMTSKISNFEDILEIDDFVREEIKLNLPGKITLIISLKKDTLFLDRISWNDNLGIRVPENIDLNSNFLINVLNNFDFLLSTSVNYSGSEPLKNFEEIERIFGEQIYVVKNLNPISQNPSKILSLLNKKKVVIRS